LTGRECTKIVKKALNLGYNHIDTAEAYGNHKEIGKALKEFDKSDIFITSKLWRSDLHYKDALKACDKVLRDLGIECLDLYLIHWPNRNVPMEETFRALKELVENGKVKSVGVSNFTINHLKDAMEISEAPINVNQVEFHPYLYQKELWDFCKDNNIQITAYSPLDRTKVFDEPTIIELTKKYDKTPAQICLRWEIEKGLVVIPKSSSETHLKQNMEIFDWELDGEDIEKMDSIKRRHRFVKTTFHEFDY
jgi:diketogulonate reductase-like aldo/keto reductase